jgi:hypothetical protein
MIDLEKGSFPADTYFFSLVEPAVSVLMIAGSVADRRGGAGGPFWLTSPSPSAAARSFGAVTLSGRVRSLISLEMG